MDSRLSLLNVPCDEVIVHVEEADADEVEDDVHPIAKTYCLLIGLAEHTHCRILGGEGGEWGGVS